MSLDRKSLEHSAASTGSRVHDMEAQKQSETTSESSTPRSEKEIKDSKDEFLVE